MEKLYVIELYQKTIKSNKKEFKVYKAIYNNKHLDCTITNDTLIDLNKDIKDKGLKMPLRLSLGEPDYFINTRAYKDNITGEKKYQNRIVISGYRLVEQGEYIKKTLDDYMDE